MFSDNKYKVFYDRKGYATIWLGGKNKKVHILVWEYYNGKKPDGYDIHHKDHNKANYNIENLELLSKSDHFKTHAGWIKENNEWVAKPCSYCGKIKKLKEFYARKTANTPSARCKKCHNN